MTQFRLSVCATAFTFLMTALGAAAVFCFGTKVSARVRRVCFGFAAGVMCAAAVFSLLVPAIEKTRERGGMPALTAGAGFLFGAAALLAADRWMEKRRRARGEADGNALLITAVTLHNIPEGMAVALACFGAADAGGAGAAAALTLALGVGLQNIPEGAAVSLPLRQSGMSRTKSFLMGAASGAVEPLAGILAALAAAAAEAMLPGLMAASAGAMMLVVVSELIPDASRDRAGTAAVMAGYVVMMALDVALG